MLRIIIGYGLIAGAIVGALLFGTTVTLHDVLTPTTGMAIGYTTMLIAFSTIFIAIKRQRDQVQGGVIHFVPAFVIGIGITLIATVFYVLAWEAALAATGLDFMADYESAMVAAKQAAGASAAEIAQLRAEMADFAVEYARPMTRMMITATEILPVGLLVSLVSAGLLCNRRFLPARPVGV